MPHYCVYGESTMSMYMYTCVCGGQRLTLALFFNYSQSYILRHFLSLKLEGNDSVRWTDLPVSSRDLPISNL